MVNYNPSFPEVLGIEWLGTRMVNHRVWGGSPAPMQRLRSTVAETIQSLRLSTKVNPLVRHNTHTVVDIIEEGDETTPLFTPVELIPNSDIEIDGWVTQTGGVTNLHDSIDDNVSQWPGPAQFEYIETTQDFQTYRCSVDAARFDAGGDLVNARIGFVEIRAIYGANTGFRKLRTDLEIGGTFVQPAGGALRDVHGFGAPYVFWWGELNPVTGLPWTPADIANFGTAGTSRLRVRSVNAIVGHTPRVHAIRLTVWCVPTENRAAVAVWKRPTDIATTLYNAETDDLITLPSGAQNWSKLANTNYLYYWRQSISPALYGAVIADDVRWNGLYQDLGPNGQPPGFAFPLSTGDGKTPPTNGMVHNYITHDQFGRPATEFEPSLEAFGALFTNAIVLERSDNAVSVDSQPYRLDIADVVNFSSGTTVAQRVTMPSTQTYLGVRLPIIPPRTANGNLTVSVHAVIGGAQVGGSFVISAADVRALSNYDVRYVTGFLASGATLNNATQYDIRLTTDVATTDPNEKWYVFGLDASLGPEASFGGATDGLVIAGVHSTGRDLAINLVRQPDAPTGVTATVEVVPCDMPDGTTRDVEHAEVTWTAPAVPLGASFLRYELERRLEDELTWTRVANIVNSGLLGYVDHLVPRDTQAFYRIRVIAKDGRFSAWAESGGVTPAQGDYDILLTSNHYPDLEVVLDVPGQEESYSFRSHASSEVLPLYGEDLQVVFKEAEDRGIDWSFRAELNFGEQPVIVKSGQRVFTALLDITRSTGTPHVAVMDFQGTKVLGYVKPGTATQTQPGHVYQTDITVTPTHVTEIPPEVS